MLLAQFLRCMDDDLSIILQAYNLPVFVLGPEKILEQFKSISKHSEKLVEFIEGNYSDAVETEIRKTLEPYLTDWKKVKHRNLLKQIKGSIDNGKVALGIHGVWQAASKRNGRLLIVEKDFIYAALHGGGEERAILKAGSILNDPFYIKDAVDDVMEKVLEIGGDVELVDNGLLQDYGRIVLIKSY
jgi:hypothetical protein